MFFRFTFPADKDELLKFLKRGVLYTFRYHVWTQGHAATNYTYWRNTMEPYEVRTLKSLIVLFEFI